MTRLILSFLQDRLHDIISFYKNHKHYVIIWFTIHTISFVFSSDNITNTDYWKRWVSSSFVWTSHRVDIQSAMWMTRELAMWISGGLPVQSASPLNSCVFPWILYTSYITVYTLNKNIIISCSNDFSLIPILMLMINILLS